MNDFTKMFSQAKKIQEKIKDAQENIKKIEVEGISGGKLVTLTLNGDGELKKIFFDPSLMKEKKEIINARNVFKKNLVKLQHQSRAELMQLLRSHGGGFKS